MFNVNYCILKVDILFLQEGNLNEFKNSAIRGLIGEGLLKNHCINKKRECEECICSYECIVQNILYKKYRTDISYIGEKEGAIFTIVCDDKREFIKSRESMEFSIKIFGGGVAYIRNIIDAIKESGINKGFEKLRYDLNWVKNDKEEDVYINNRYYLSNIKVRKVKDYIRKRLEIDEEIESLNIINNIRFKKNKKLSDEINEEDLLRLIKRRLIGLNSFEGRAIEFNDEAKLKFSYKKIYWNSINRYSNRKSQLLNIGGIKGYIEIEECNREAKELLIAGELINIGKVTSMGLGDYILY